MPEQSGGPLDPSRGASGTVGDEEREARLALACVVEPGDPRIGPLVTRSGAVAVWASLREPDAVPAWAGRAAALDLRPVRLLARRHGLRFVIPGDGEWPTQLGALDHCETVQESCGQPLGLWVRGDLPLAEVALRSVALVGSRASTAYGERIAGDLSAGLTAAGLTVVSGGAYGIDAAAHRGALAEGGPTVAIMAGGLDVPYPRGNEALLASVARSGLLVSELPPGEHPTRRRFLTRNRLIAALSAGTVIVEAAHRSGARNTVTWANACARPVMAVPGPVGSATSVTPHRLIRDGEAVLVTSVDEIREMVGLMGEVDLSRPAQDRLLEGLTPQEQAVYEALPSRGTRDVGDLALRAGVPLPVCLGLLAHLATFDLAQPAADGGWRLGRAQDRPVAASAEEQEHR